ncbi:MULTISPECIES: aminodeoxychorismate synthase component I [Psychrilyobacter]|uniref:aminodeoxychorismate synthase n=1 Tax=Psychrilyobacter piezotolerans TaxID=2293438 RepID=A0ABX9KEQ0_9FUSO|nr:MULTISPECIES: aminodeoxychorismate synthase component I [Psychrilyobacter]MCS5422741.1 aminodeoxychorismate synthase component I [Psychrilyobacter sp. S5]NDI78700.1 aminodeoxychorismate synthase component I [Psychrilyobacter piezotolerans]RDE59875.1 aminodeoxychorismate synthase component I [Psychrilyobacter sp. S5]REI40156.1 aminodeoxychorismate synthase component I [Psychrilyobacter piezotolerans]
MKKAKIIEFKSNLNSMELFEAVKKDGNYPFFLDSGMDSEKLGRYSFIGVDPFLVIKSEGNRVSLEEDGKIKTMEGNPLDILQEKLNLYKIEREEIPFVGGGVGYFSYELAHLMEKLPNTVKKDVDIPEMVMGFYDGIIIIDHRDDKKYIGAIGFKQNIEEIIKKIEKNIEQYEKKIKTEEIGKKVIKNRDINSNMTEDYYLASIKKLKDYIYSGDIYQVNFTQRFQCDFQGDSNELYKNLKLINPAPFAAYLDFGEGEIISSSPERFIKLTDGTIETRPMKGTRPRGKSKAEDEKLKAELINSEKDRAELLMIVDLMRNDISRVAKTGSVKVTELFHLEEYATVLQMVATIEGELKDELSAVDIIKATFPGGSITGAPKIRAMEIIDELETTARNIYTGSIGYLGFDGDMDLNIAIRTIVLKDGSAYFQVGGGIVWDSDPHEEYEESLVKGRALVKALNIT